MSLKNYKKIENILYKKSPDEAISIIKNKRYSLSKRERFDLLIAIGAELWADDRDKKAKKIFNKALKNQLNKNDKAEAYLYLGRIAIDEENYESAIDLFKKGLAITKDRYLLGAINYGLSRCYYSIPDRKKSIEYAYKSLKYHDVKNKKERYDYYVNLQTIIENLLLMGEKEKAEAIIKKYFKNRNIPEGILSDIHRAFGHYFYKRENWTEALKNYAIALRNFDSSYLSSKGIILKYLGSCYMQLEDYQKAKATYLQSLEYLLDDEDAKDKAFVKEELKIINHNLRM